MLRTSDKDLGSGLFISYQLHYMPSGENSEDKSKYRSVERFKSAFGGIMSFARKHLKLPKDLTVRLGYLKKRGVTAEFSPNLNLIAVEPQPDFSVMIKAFLFQLVQADQIKSGRMVPLSDNAYQWKDHGHTEVVTVPRSFLSRPILPHVSDAESRTEHLFEEFKENNPDVFTSANVAEVTSKAKAERNARTFEVHPSLKPENVSDDPAPVIQPKRSYRRKIASPGSILPDILEKRKARRNGDNPKDNTQSE